VRASFAALLLYLSAAPAASTISGRVTEAGSGRPLPRILVTLVGTDGSELAETLTDDDGRYRFTGVGTGRYAVSAAPGEHRADHLRQWFGEKEPAPRWGRPPRYPLDMAGGRDIPDVDIAMLVALGIEGRVLSPWEEGMANVPVVAMRADGSPVNDNPVASDDLGNYRLFRLAPGRYRVCANPTERAGEDGGTALPFVQTCYPSATAERAAADVTLTSSDATGIDIRVQRTGGRTMSGTVVDAQGMPANGTYVSAISIDTSNRTGSATVRDGGFSITGLVPGEYIVRASIGGQRLGDPNPASREREMAFAEVDLTAVDTTNVTLMLSRAAKLRGRVVIEGAPPSASLIARLIARAYPPDSRAILFSEPQATAPVRDDATFELPEIFRLPQLITLQGLPDDWKVKRVRHDGREVTYVPTDFSTSREPIEVTITNRLARPVVRVTDAEGQSVTDARVLAVPAAPKAGVMPFGAIDGRPSADGDIKLGPLPAGDYLLVALSPDELNLLFFDRSRVASLAQIGTRVTLKEDESPRIDLRLARLPEKR
jgi:hypothetical protein